MLNKILPALFDTAIDALKEEINLYETETAIWKVAPGIANSGGNLCLHLCGNIRHFVGAVLGDTGYQRDRPYEFAAKDLPRSVLLEAIEDTRKTIHTVIPTLSDELLAADFKDNPMNQPMTYGTFVTHLYGHFRYHTGQINYHRRLIQ